MSKYPGDNPPFHPDVGLRNQKNVWKNKRLHPRRLAAGTWSHDGERMMIFLFQGVKTLRFQPLIFWGVNRPCSHFFVSSTAGFGSCLWVFDCCFSVFFVGSQNDHCRRHLRCGLVRETTPKNNLRVGFVNYQQINLTRIKLGGNSNICLFSSLFGEDDPNLTSIFFKWVGWNHHLEKAKFRCCHRYI